MAQGRNPFRYLRPVPPKEFLGRWPIIEEIASDLTLDEGDSYAVIGGRRFGKSSLLTALHHYLRQPEAQEGDHVVLPLLIDFKRAFPSETAFFAHILHEIHRRVDANARGRIKDPSPVKVSLDQVRFDDLLTEDTFGLSLTQFEERVDYILDKLYQANGPTRLVLLLDEVDDILDYSWHKTLFNQLRALVYSGDMADCVRLVLSGSRRFLDSVTDRGSPLWNILKLHYFNAFDETTTYELIARAENLPEAIQQAVWQQSGGHPFLAQYLLHHLWKKVLDQTTEATVTQIVDCFLHEEQAHLNGWASGIEEIGLQIYSHFINRSDWLDEMELIRLVDAEPNAIKRGLVALSYHGFIIHDGTWSRYRRTGDLFRQWYLSKYGSPETFRPNEEDKEMQPTVFISYSQADESEKEQLLSHLGVLQSARLIDVWSEDRIAAGADWETEIDQAIAQARVAVLLISASFLSTDFIVNQTIPTLLQRRKDEGLVVFPVIAKACAWQKVDWLAKMSVRPRNRRPVWSDGGSHADEDLAAIAEEIATIVNQARPVPLAQQSHPETSEASVIPPQAEQPKPLHKPKRFNTAKIRRLLNTAFDDPGLDAFCQDYFYAVFKNFGRGQRKDEKITLLLDHCRRAQNGFKLLLDAVRSECEADASRQEELEPLLLELERVVT